METAEILEYVFGKDLKQEHFRPTSRSSSNLETGTSCRYLSLSEGLDKALEATIYHGEDEGAIGYSDEGVIDSDRREGRLGPTLVRFDMSTHVGQFVMDRDRLHLISHSNFSSIRANVCLYEGKWQYEVQLGSKGIMQVGWATVNCKFSHQSGVGDTAKSFAYDGHRQRKWNVRTAHYGEPWLGGDIIGCTLDLQPSSNCGTVEFFRNGHSMGVAFNNVPVGRGEAYFPAVSMAFSESLVANFGAAPFRHPVPGFEPIQKPPMKKLAYGRVLIKWLSRVVSLLPKSPEETLEACHTTRKSERQKKGVIKSKENENQGIPVPIFWVASLVLHRLGPLLNSAFVVQAILIPFMEELVGSTEETGPHYHLSKLLDFFWTFLEEHEITPMLENVALSLLCSFRMTPSPQQTRKALESPSKTGLLELFRDQHRSLNLLLEFVKHQQTRRHLILHVFFSRIGFFSFLNMKPLDEEALAEAVKKPWFDRSPPPKRLLEESSKFSAKDKTIEDPNDRKIYTDYLKSISKLENAIEALEKKQVEFIKWLMSNDDGTPNQPSSRHVFMKKFHKYLEELFSSSRPWIPLLVTPVTTSLCLFQRLVSVFQILWKEEVCLAKNSHRVSSQHPSLEEFFLQNKYFYNGSIDLFASDRLGGVPSHLVKQFREELLRANVPHDVISSSSSSSSLFHSAGVSSRMSSLVSLFQRRLRAFGVERGISENMLPNAESASDNPLDTQSNMPSLLGAFPSALGPVADIDLIGRRRRWRIGMLEINDTEEKEENLGIGPVDTVISLVDLFNSVVLLYQLEAHRQLGRISTIHEKMHEYAVALKLATGRMEACRERIARISGNEQELQDERLVEKELIRSVEVFEQKLKSQARDLAWVKACIFSKSKQIQFAWMLRCVLRTLKEASNPSSISIYSSQTSTSSSSTESLTLEDQKRLFAFIPYYYLDALVGLCTALRSYFHPTAPIENVEDHEELLYEVGLFLCNHFYEPRIVHASSKDTLIQALAAFFCAPPALKVLEKLPPSSLEGLVRNLLRPYENRPWAQSNFILVRIWQGNGYAFRYARSPHLRTRLGPKLNAPEGPCLSGPAIDPCPSPVFQQQIGKLLREDEPLATSFINSVLNQLNWAFSEFIGMLQEIQNAAGRTNTQVFIESRELKICATCFDLALSLLRVLEMVTIVSPQVFTDPSRLSSDMLLSRLCQLLCQVLNRVACAPGNGNGTTIGPGCFSHVVNLDVSDLESVDHFPMLAAVAGVLFGLLNPEIKNEKHQPPSKGTPVESIPRVTEAILSDPSFQIGSLYFLLGGPEAFEDPKEENCEGATGLSPAGTVHPSFSFANYPSAINEDEINLLKEAVSWLNQWQDVLSTDANSKSRIPEEELCTICYAFPATAKFFPCKHTSCRCCIVHHLMNHEECFFCKALIETVVDERGHVIYGQKPPEKKGD